MILIFIVVTSQVHKIVRGVSNQLHSEDNVLTIEDLESSFEGLDLLLPCLDTILEAHFFAHASRLEFFVVRKCSIEFLLGAFKVNLLLLQRLLLVLLAFGGMVQV